jgi:putative two-component system response regulator
MAPDPYAAQTGEAHRLYALRSYQVVGTGPEAGFDRLVGLAARLFGVPMAFVSLVDEDRQWYKACFGMALEETPHSLCARAIESDDLLVVQDAALDARFAGDPLVMAAPHVRFYAGAPLVVEGGTALGTLCLVDTVPRPDLTAEERQLLKDLAASVVSELELRRVMLAQRRSEAIRQAMLDTALDSVVTMNQDGRVTEWNPAAERMFGWTPDEALGQDLSELVIPHAQRAAHRRELAHYLASGEGLVLGTRTELSAFRKDGSEFPSELAITAFKVGVEVMFTAYMRDLSDRQQAETALADSHNLLQSVVNGVPESMFVKDLEGRYVMINAAGAAFLGRSIEEILGQDDHSLFSPETAKIVRSRDAEVMASGQALSYELSDPTPENPGRAVLANKRVYRDAQGKVLGLIGMSLDISERKRAEYLIQNYNQELESRVQERTRALEDTQFEVLDRLARAAEHRDDETGEHVRRVASMAAALAHDLGLCPEDVELLRRAAPLHDVGKIGVPDGILLKPGALTQEEFQIIRTHTTIGGNILSGGNSRLVQAAQEVALTHHERWDGAGYPRGLRAEEIPLFGRIVAVADVYDALTSTRPYKTAWSSADALVEIRSQAGSQFDPQIVVSLERVLAAVVPAFSRVEGDLAPHPDRN